MPRLLLPVRAMERQRQRQGVVQRGCLLVLLCRRLCRRAALCWRRWLRLRLRPVLRVRMQKMRWSPWWSCCGAASGLSAHRAEDTSDTACANEQAAQRARRGQQRDAGERRCARVSASCVAAGAWAALCESSVEMEALEQLDSKQDFPKNLSMGKTRKLLAYCILSCPIVCKIR